MFISPEAITLFGFVALLGIKQNGVFLQEINSCVVDRARHFVGYRLNIDALMTTCEYGKVNCYLSCLRNVSCRSFAVVKNATCESLCLLYPQAIINQDYFVEDNTSIYYFMASQTCCKSACMNGGLCDSKTCTCQCPKGFSSTNCRCATQNLSREVAYSWRTVPGQMKQIDSGNETWAVQDNDFVFILESMNWVPILGRLIHVTCGRAGVWGISPGHYIYFRTGKTKVNPKGTVWRRVIGGLTQIDSGNYGVVYGINSLNQIFCRSGINESLPHGKYWLQVPGLFKYVSCGIYGCWAIKLNNSISFRTGVTSVRCAGLAWQDVEGSLVQLEAGFTGEVYGVTEDGNLYVREEVCALNPTEERWKRVKSTAFTHVTIGMSSLFGIAKNGSILATP